MIVTPELLFCLITLAIITAMLVASLADIGTVRTVPTTHTLQVAPPPADQLPAGCVPRCRATRRTPYPHNNVA